ncbi:hypothetical protein BC940DRAFT_370856 [Gongronella butleri]|nr:hypothetical protein BC940DRAFT_370856 [Gongronella butleri]
MELQFRSAHTQLVSLRARRRPDFLACLFAFCLAPQLRRTWLSSMRQKLTHTTRGIGAKSDRVASTAPSSTPSTQAPKKPAEDQKRWSWSPSSTGPLETIQEEDE